MLRSWSNPASTKNIILYDTHPWRKKFVNHCCKVFLELCQTKQIWKNKIKTYFRLNISLYIFTIYTIYLFINRFLIFKKKNHLSWTWNNIFIKVWVRNVPCKREKLFSATSQMLNRLISLMLIPHHWALKLSIEFLHINIKIYPK